MIRWGKRDEGEGTQKFCFRTLFFSCCSRRERACGCRHAPRLACSFDRRERSHATCKSRSSKGQSDPCRPAAWIFLRRISNSLIETSLLATRRRFERGGSSRDRPKRSVIALLQLFLGRATRRRANNPRFSSRRVDPASAEGLARSLAREASLATRLKVLVATRGHAKVIRQGGGPAEAASGFRNVTVKWADVGRRACRSNAREVGVRPSERDPRPDLTASSKCTSNSQISSMNKTTLGPEMPRESLAQRAACSKHFR